MNSLLLHCICRLLALGVFHCGAQNFNAIGGTADINWPPAPIASEAYDPTRTKGTAFCCDARPLVHFKPAIPSP